MSGAPSCRHSRRARPNVPAVRGWVTASGGKGQAVTSRPEVSVQKGGIPSLATIGATAPFVGLLGTVIGVINAFHGISTTGSGGLGAVSGGISEALVETALGLVVAIPAVWMYNYFTAKLDTLFSELAYAGREMIDWMMTRQARQQLGHNTGVNATYGGD